MPRVVIRLGIVLLVAFVGGTADAGWGLVPFGGWGKFPRQKSFINVSVYREGVSIFACDLDGPRACPPR